MFDLTATGVHINERRSYIQNFKYSSATSDEFKVGQQKFCSCCLDDGIGMLFKCLKLQAFFLQYFKDNDATAVIDWDTWFYAPGVAFLIEKSTIRCKAAG